MSVLVVFSVIVFNVCLVLLMVRVDIIRMWVLCVVVMMCGSVLSLLVLGIFRLSRMMLMWVFVSVWSVCFMLFVIVVILRLLLVCVRCVSMVWMISELLMIIRCMGCFDGCWMCVGCGDWVSECFMIWIFR